MIYGLHLLTKSEWQDQLEVLYHPLLEKTEHNRVRYEKNFKELETNHEKRLEKLIVLSDMLMD